jgi:hypothetical protein
MDTWIRPASASSAGAGKSSGGPARTLAVLAVSLLVFSVMSFSGEVLIGLHGGLSMPNIRGNTPQSEGYVSRRGPFFGVTADFGITPHFSICAEVNYSSQGGKQNGMQPLTSDQVSGLSLPPGMTLFANFRNEAILDYIEIPLMARLTWGGSVRFFVQAGPYVGFRARAKTETRGMSQLFLDSSGTPLLDPSTGQPLPAVSFDANTDIKQDIRSTTAGITGGAGIAARFGPGDIILDARFEWGLTNIQSDPALNGENRTGAVVVIVGYCFAFEERR